MQTLPTEIIHDILLNLDYSDIINFSRTNRIFYKKINEDFWRRIYLRDFGAPDRIPSSWKISYAENGSIISANYSLPGKYRQAIVNYYYIYLLDIHGNLYYKENNHDGKLNLLSTNIARIDDNVSKIVRCLYDTDGYVIFMIHPNVYYSDVKALKVGMISYSNYGPHYIMTYIRPDRQLGLIKFRFVASKFVVSDVASFPDRVCRDLHLNFVLTTDSEVFDIHPIIDYFDSGYKGPHRQPILIIDPEELVSPLEKVLSNESGNMLYLLDDKNKLYYYEYSLFEESVPVLLIGNIRDIYASYDMILIRSTQDRIYRVNQELLTVGSVVEAGRGLSGIKLMDLSVIAGDFIAIKKSP